MMAGVGENVSSISFCADRKGMVKWRKEEIVHNFFSRNNKAGEKRLEDTCS